MGRASLNYIMLFVLYYWCALSIICCQRQDTGVDGSFVHSIITVLAFFGVLLWIYLSQSLFPIIKPMQFFRLSGKVILSLLFLLNSAKTIYIQKFLYNGKIQNINQNVLTSVLQWGISISIFRNLQKQSNFQENYASGCDMKSVGAEGPQLTVGKIKPKHASIPTNFSGTIHVLKFKYTSVFRIQT